MFAAGKKFLKPAIRRVFFVLTFTSKWIYEVERRMDAKAEEERYGAMPWSLPSSMTIKTLIRPVCQMAKSARLNAFVLSGYYQ